MVGFSKLNIMNRDFKALITAIGAMSWGGERGS